MQTAPAANALAVHPLALVPTPMSSRPDQPDLALILAEIDDLAERTAALRARLSRLAAGSGPRPGWPIRRLVAPPG